MGLLILFILDCVVAFILVLIYAFIMKNYYKRNNSHFSFFSVFAWSVFLFFLCHLLLPWIFSVSSWLLPFIPFAVIFFISFHNTFRVIRHYKIFLLMFLFFYSVSIIWSPPNKKKTGYMRRNSFPKIFQMKVMRILNL